MMLGLRSGFAISAAGSVTGGVNSRVTMSWMARLVITVCFMTMFYFADGTNGRSSHASPGSRFMWLMLLPFTERCGFQLHIRARV